MVSHAAGRSPIPLLASTLVILTGAAACSEVFLRARELQVSPNPAQPGDTVSFSLRLGVIPEQNYLVVAFINDHEHQSVAGFESLDSTYVMTVGAADDLITQYGLGTHTAYVEVRLTDRNRTARTADVSFVLEAAPPPP